MTMQDNVETRPQGRHRGLDKNGVLATVQAYVGGGMVDGRCSATSVRTLVQRHAVRRAAVQRWLRGGSAGG